MDLEPVVIFEDEEMLAVSKPAGMVVNRSKTSGHLWTLQDWLMKKGLGKGGGRQGIVHRLDKETSGVLVVAKSVRVFKALQLQFKNRQVIKKYLGLVHGQIRPKIGTVKAPIKRSPFNRTRFGVFVGGKGAETSYWLKEEFAFKNQQLSLVEIAPKTGRTHQIRVHFKHLGYPIVADTIYAGKRQARADRLWCPRLFLHASFLEISSPTSDKKLKFKAELPEDLTRVLMAIKDGKKS